MLKSLLSQLAKRGRPSPRSDLPGVAPHALPFGRDAVEIADAPAAATVAEPMQLPLGAVEPPAALQRRFVSSRDVTLLLPTVAHRAEFLRSALDFMSVAMKGAQIVISDHTEDADNDTVARLASQFAQLDIVVERHPASLHFLERLTACARLARSPYVVVHADDDFMLPGAIDESVSFLDRHPDFVGCQGRTFFLKLRPPRSCAPKIHGATARAEGDAVSRIASQCTQFTPTLYAVTRRNAFIEANDATLRHTKNVVFWQYLSSCQLLTLGKSHVLDSLYYLRLDNPDGWRATLIREGDRSHWPHLVVAKEFSKELAAFKGGLAAALGAADSKDVARVVDDCSLSLIRRAFNPVWQHETAELDLLARASVTGSTENLIIRYCGRLSLAALTRLHG